MDAKAFNFDVGVKNYKKNRLIVNDLQLKNEIFYNIERNKKNKFQISLVSYLNSEDNPLSFFNVLRDLEASNLDKSFNFYINRSGNMISNVEMNDPNFFYPEVEKGFNVVVCLSGFRFNKNNNLFAEDLYTTEQIKTLEQVFETYLFNGKEVSFEELNVSSNLEKISNVGFDIKQFLIDTNLD